MVKNNSRINKFLIEDSEAIREKALVYKHFIYKTLKDYDAGVKNDTKTDLEIKIDLIHAIRYIYCSELGINPNGVRVDFVDDMSKVTGKDGSIAISRMLHDLEREYERYFAEVVFESNKVAHQHTATFVYIVAHEMHHIYQKVMKAYGRFAFASDNKSARCGTEFENSWCELLYDVSLTELDANVSSLQKILKWLDEVEEAGLESAGGLNEIKKNISKCQSTFVKRYMASIAKTGGFVLVNGCSWLLVVCMISCPMTLEWVLQVANLFISEM